MDPIWPYMGPHMGPYGAHMHPYGVHMGSYAGTAHMDPYGLYGAHVGTYGPSCLCSCVIVSAFILQDKDKTKLMNAHGSLMTLYDVMPFIGGLSQSDGAAERE